MDWRPQVSEKLQEQCLAVVELVQFDSGEAAHGLLRRVRRADKQRLLALTRSSVPQRGRRALRLYKLSGERLAVTRSWKGEDVAVVDGVDEPADISVSFRLTFRDQGAFTFWTTAPEQRAEFLLELLEVLKREPGPGPQVARLEAEELRNLVGRKTVDVAQTETPDSADARASPPPAAAAGLGRLSTSERDASSGALSESSSTMETERSGRSIPPTTLNETAPAPAPFVAEPSPVPGDRMPPPDVAAVIERPPPDVDDFTTLRALRPSLHAAAWDMCAATSMPAFADEQAREHALFIRNAMRHSQDVLLEVRSKLECLQQELQSEETRLQRCRGDLKHIEPEVEALRRAIPPLETYYHNLLRLRRALDELLQKSTVSEAEWAVIERLVDQPTAVSEATSVATLLAEKRAFCEQHCNVRAVAEGSAQVNRAIEQLAAHLGRAVESAARTLIEVDDASMTTAAATMEEDAQRLRVACEALLRMDPAYAEGLAEVLAAAIAESRWWRAEWDRWRTLRLPSDSDPEEPTVWQAFRDQLAQCWAALRQQRDVLAKRLRRRVAVGGIDMATLVLERLYGPQASTEVERALHRLADGELQSFVWLAAVEVLRAEEEAGLSPKAPQANGGRTLGRLGQSTRTEHGPPPRTAGADNQQTETSGQREVWLAWLGELRARCEAHWDEFVESVIQTIGQRPTEALEMLSALCYGMFVASDGSPESGRGIQRLQPHVEPLVRRLDRVVGAKRSPLRESGFADRLAADLRDNTRMSASDAAEVARLVERAAQTPL
eukprot:ctg_1872.g702